jgi:hypothetical protein
VADRYWIASSSANWNDTANWSTSSGGSGGASVPGSSDDAHFDGNGTGDCTVNATVSINNITFASYTGTFDANDNDLTFTGDVSLDSSVTYISGAGTITLSGSNDQDIDFNGESVEDIEIDKTSGTVTLTGDLETASFKITDGAFDCSTYNLICTGNFDVDRADAVFDAGSGTHEIGGNFLKRQVGTWTCGTAHFKLQGASNSITSDSSSSEIIYDLTVETGASYSGVFGRIGVENSITVESGATLSIKRVGLNGSSTTPTITINGSVTLGEDCILGNENGVTIGGTGTLTQTTGTCDFGWDNDNVAQTCTFAASTDLTIAGAGTFDLGHGLWTATLTYDCSNNPSFTIEAANFLVNPNNKTVVWTKGSSGDITFSGTANQTIGLDGLSYQDFIINKTGGTLTLSEGGTTESLTFTDGTLDIDGQDLDITGNFTMAAGTVVNDTDTGGSISIGGNLDINGIDGTGCTWSDADIDTLAGTGDADYCTVSNSNNSSGTAIDATDNCTDSGGNTGWTFAAGGYTLTAAGGAITLTGTAADLTYDRKLSAAAGAVGLTGTAANLEKGYSLTAEAGAITLTGTAAGFLYNQVVSAGAGAIALAGTAADLTYDRKLSAEAGTVTITGADATLTYTQDYSVTAEAGAIALTGTAAALTYDRIMPAAAGAIVLTGADATLLYSQGYNLTADAGAISLTGAAATLTVDRILTAEAAAIALAGTAAGLNVGIVLTAEAGAVALTGTVAGLTYDHVLAAAAGAIALTGTAATLTYSEEQIPVGHVTAAATAGRPGVSISATKPTITIT